MRQRKANTGEQGAVMVMFAIGLPVLILFASFVIDVGTWFVHDRHLQTQADAGVLAAAGDYRYPCDASVDSAVKARAEEYGGVDGTGYNQQVGGTSLEDVHLLVNSPSYYDQPSLTDPNPVEGTPCESAAIDVKVTETDLPLFFHVASLFTEVPFINAHARVGIFEKEFLSGALPLAVPDPDPQKVKVTLVDEENGGAPIESVELSKEEGGEGGLAYWSNEAEPVSLPVETGRIGMKVTLSGSESTECGQPLVQCYPESGPGLLFARGWSADGLGEQPGEPIARDVYLTSDGICDPYFTSEEAGCSVGVHADVDFGPCDELGEEPEKVGAKLEAVVAGSTYEMHLAAEEGSEPCPAGSSTSHWETSGAPIPIAAGSGPVAVSLKWEETEGKQGGNDCKVGGGNKCKGTFAEVQRSFAGDDETTGPIRFARLDEGAGLWANSFQRCEGCAYPVVVRIGLDQNREENAASAESPPVMLRVEDASQNQSLDCDPDISQLSKELAHGCAPKYTKNAGTECPSQINVLWNETPEPWECVAVQTGKAKGQIMPGMNERVHGESNPSTCVAPSHWPLYPNLPAGDPRVVSLFLTAFGSFSGTGNTTVPVTGFATFYVTGWAGQGGGQTSRDICDGSNGETPDDEAAAGTIVGHFIKYVQALNDGSGSERKCDFSSLNPCVAELTE